MTSTQKRLAIVAFYVGLLTLFGLFLSGLRPARVQAQRGIWFPNQALPPALSVDLATPLGTTVDLTQYNTDAELAQALATMRSMGITWIRQELRWDEIEARKGMPDWSNYERGIRMANEAGLAVVAVLNRTPVWARQPEEADNPLAPPQDLTDLAGFAEAAALQYGNEVVAWQVWDEPNLMPHWGTEVIIDPAKYAEMLREVAPSIRAKDVGAWVVTAGLGPTLEPGGFNMSEVRFLDGLYAAGAADDFDAVALKPYGFWTGADEALYDEGVLNFDRPVLVREVMEAHEDTATSIWFVEGGWAVLPGEWQGDPPPWGSDSAEQQQPRLQEALTRTALEWQWVQLVALQPFQPNVPPTNPQIGLGLVDGNGDLTALGETTSAFGNDFYQGEQGVAARAEWELLERPQLYRWDNALWLTIGTIGLLGVRLAWHMLRLPWRSWGDLFRRQSDGVQLGIFALVTLAFYQIDHLVIALVLYGAVGVLIAWQLRLGLAGVAFALPFFLQVKALGSLQFSMVELLLVWCVGVWGLQTVLKIFPFGALDRNRVSNGRNSVSVGGRPQGSPLQEKRSTSLWEGLRLFLPQDGLDWAVFLFVAWAGISIFFADLFGVASREFRVVVLGSGLYYWVLRRQPDKETIAEWVIHGLLAGAVVVSLYGLYQWLFTGDIITAEGVRRIRGTYGSPNNLALFLERVIPIGLALWLIGSKDQKRWLYAAALVPIGLCLLLTFSRGALLLGVPAGLLWVALWGGKRVRQAVIAVGIVGALALIPFATTERLASTTNVEGGTWFIRMKLWEATLTMIRENPVLGVGLDNFLYTYEQYRLPEAWREPDLSHPHQILLHFWVALGIPGLLFLIWQQVAFWRGWWTQQQQALSEWHRAMLIGVGGSMVATLAHGMIDNSYFLVDLAFVWMLTLAVGTKIINGEK
jgi:O-antigen ligase